MQVRIQPVRVIGKAQLLLNLPKSTPENMLGASTTRAYKIVSMLFGDACDGDFLGDGDDDSKKKIYAEANSKACLGGCQKNNKVACPLMLDNHTEGCNWEDGYQRECDRKSTSFIEGSCRLCSTCRVGRYEFPIVSITPDRLYYSSYSFF